MADIPQDKQLAAVGQGAVVAQMPHELPDIYQWMTRDVLGAASTLSRLSERAGVFSQSEPSEGPELVMGERGDVHRVRDSDFVFEFPTASIEPIVHRPVPTSSERLVRDSVLRVGDGVPAAAPRP
ncbi:hypothetical protein PIB30_015632 [Stylosanthes scabra]|uniref:Uncharacterized protein n=1 Tax=Stylosanthes scabra TaxID=79078 RepID=A0ABU6S7B1_9FABA|nr:hypothetical protein [Stylosanthes scabra]